jgi:hypothetical protein
LIGKCADQLDLPLGEGLDPLPRENDMTDNISSVQQRHP